MIKSVHNEIDKLMFGLLYAGYLSKHLQNTAFFFIDTAFFFVTTFITQNRLLTLITFHIHVATCIAVEYPGLLNNSAYG